MNPLGLARRRDGIPLAFQKPGPALTLPKVTRRGVEWSTHLRGYADVVAFETNPTFRRAPLRPPDAAPHFLFNAPWFVDGDLHREYRAAASPPLRSAARVAGYEPMIRDVAEKWVEQGTAPDVFDLVADVLQPFALEVVGRILGARGEEIPGFMGHLAAVAEHEDMGTYPPPGPFGTGLDTVIAAARPGALTEFRGKLAAPSAPACFAGREGDLERGFGGAALLAGTDTFAMTVANGFALAQRTGNWWRELLRSAGYGPDADTFVAAYFEEAMRLLPAFPAGAAVPDEDVTLPSGARVRAGRLTVAWFMAAGRDPAVFDHPERIDLARAGEHLGFGWGVHYCWGAALARLEIRVMVPMLLAAGIRPLDGGRSRRRIVGRVNRLVHDPYTHGRDLP